MGSSIKFSGYQDLKVWQKSVDLVVSVYKVTKIFPDCERYGLASQMQRAAVSIPSNIAEGQSRATSKDFIHFLRIAYASAAELETQLIIAGKLEYTEEVVVSLTRQQIQEVAKMLAGLMAAIRTNN